MLKLETIRAKIRGITPLLMHNGQTANPLNPFAKKLKSLTSKRNKTEEDHLAILDVQWQAGLYWDDELGVHIPTENLYAAFGKAARRHKLGTKCCGVGFINPKGYPLNVDNARNFQKLHADPNNKLTKIVAIQKAKTLSCRPFFKNWGLEFDLEYEPDIIDQHDIITILQTFASRIGLGCWTPSSPKGGMFGKFLYESIEKITGNKATSLYKAAA